MSGQLVIPVALEDGETRFHDPSLVRLPEWLERLAADLDSKDDTADLYMQEIVGLKNWAELVRELLARARSLNGNSLGL